MNLGSYNNDGADSQSRAVLALLQPFGENFVYDSDKTMNVGRWENCREQGYVISSRGTKLGDYVQFNIAFFTHRNNDSICALKWEQVTINTPNIDAAIFGNVYKDKWDLSVSMTYGSILEMSEWIQNEFTEFWEQKNEK